jgi:hypothetical protein
VRYIAGIRMFLILISLLLLLGCDRGVRYYPSGWEVERGGQGWRKELESAEFSTSGIGGFIGSEGITVEFKVTNKAPVNMVLSSATLQTRNNSYVLDMPAKGEVSAEWRTVLPGATQRITLGWSFPGQEPLPEVLGSTPSIILNFREGSQQNTINIKYFKKW